MPKREAMPPKVTIRRDDMLRKLQTVAPALASGTIPSLNHVWFTGTRLMAYNDALAVSVPHQASFTGGVPGALLTNVLKEVTKDEINLEPEGNGVLLTAVGSSMKTTFPVLPPEDLIFDWPEPHANDILRTILFDEELRAGLKACLRSLGKGGSMAETHGVTIVAEPFRVVLYATNALTMSRVLVTSPISDATTTTRVILPTAFCEQVVKLARETEGELRITERYALFTSDEVSIFARLFANPNPVDFEKAIERHLSSAVLKAAIAIPSNLPETLKRSYAITKEGKEPVAVFTVAAGALKIEAATDRGQNRDLIKFADHPNVTAKFEPRLVHKAIDSFDRIIIQPSALALIADTVLYLVSAKS